MFLHEANICHGTHKTPLNLNILSQFLAISQAPVEEHHCPIVDIFGITFIVFWFITVQIGQGKKTHKWLMCYGHHLYINHLFFNFLVPLSTSTNAFFLQVKCINICLIFHICQIFTGIPDNLLQRTSTLKKITSTY